MRFSELQRQTNANIQDKANLIWEIATHLVGLFKPHEYGKVILPLTVLKRFDDGLRPTKDAVIDANAQLKKRGVKGETRDGILRGASGYDFYNTSRFDFFRLVADPDNIADNFSDYLLGYSDNVKDIYLMTELLIAPEREAIAANGCTKTACDMAMGTSQMLSCLDERLKSMMNILAIWTRKSQHRLRETGMQRKMK